MTKKPINYENACIYKLCCKDTNITDCYVGSTTNFRSRKSRHKSNCNNENNRDFNLKVYQFIRDNGSWCNWDMVLVEKPKVNDSYELHKQERKYIEELNSTLNQVIPTRTRNERNEIYKDEIKKYHIEYRKKNRDKILEYKKEYSKNNEDKILEYKKEWYENNKQYNKEYYENNKEYYKEYREKNKVKLSEKSKEKIECPICNSLITKCNLPRHKKSKKCMSASN